MALCLDFWLAFCLFADLGASRISTETEYLQISHEEKMKKRCVGLGSNFNSTHFIIFVFPHVHILKERRNQ